jgi:CubicO group peptidase (beta-lactamase class C family)
MGDLPVEVSPIEVGFDPDRLDRIERHFGAFVDDGRLAGWLAVVTRHGQVAYVASRGHRDREAAAPVERDTLWRIYSMTKPITSVAAMMLYEQGAFELKDPVHRYIESFRNQRVYRSGSSQAPITVPATEPVRVWHLLTHTSGLTYGFHYAHPVDAMYRAAGFEWGSPPDLDLAGSVDVWASMPLLFEPGTEWNYSVSSDVLGRLVEVVSGQPLDRFLAEQIFEPLGMTDTGFSVPTAEHDRLAKLYGAGPKRTAVPLDAWGKAVLAPPKMLSGGGGAGLPHGRAQGIHRLEGEVHRGHIGAVDALVDLGPVEPPGLHRERNVRVPVVVVVEGGAFGRRVEDAETDHREIALSIGWQADRSLPRIGARASTRTVPWSSWWPRRSPGRLPCRGRPGPARRSSRSC